MKYICDQMLGTLAKWLRIFGFDTFYANSEMDDSELIDISRKEKRILITRDKNLLQIARKEKVKVIEINNIDIDQQINKVITQDKVDLTKVLCRCILCNSKIVEIEKDKVNERVPKRVFEGNEMFWFCPKCKKIYWKGTHYENMIQKINFLKNLG
jgi:uncharacterized protein with PIN domain